MKAKNILSGILLTAGLFCSFSSQALESSSPIGLSLFPPIQFPNSDFGIHGLRVSLVGVNRETKGLDIGLINATHEVHGIQIGLINFNESGPFKASPIINAAF